MSPQVQVSTLLLEKNGFTLGGTGPSYGEVIRYSENFLALGVFADVLVVRVEIQGTTGALDGSQAEGTGTVTFQIKPSVTLTLDTR